MIFRKKHIAPVQLHTVDTLTVAGFIRCLYRNELTAMVAGGNPSVAQCKIAWMQLFEKYCEMVESPDYGEISQIYRNILKYSSWILAAETFVKVLFYRRNQEAIDGLRMFGYDFAFPENDPAQYMKDLHAVQTRLKAIHIRLKDESNKLQALTDKAETAARSDEQSFMDNIIILTRFVGYFINIDKVTVAQFAAMQRQYQRFLRKKEMEKNG